MLVKSDMDIEIHKDGLFNDWLIYKDTGHLHLFVFSLACSSRIWSFRRLQVL